MATNAKLAKERETAERIAEMTQRFFEKLPKTEQKIRLKAIKKPDNQLSLRKSRSLRPKGLSYGPR